MTHPLECSPALRLATGRARLVSKRPAVVIGGLLAHAGVLSAHTIWPSAAAPILIAGAGDREAAAWMDRTFRLRSRQTLLGAALWNVLRCRHLLVGPTPSLMLRAVERGLGRALLDPRAAFYGTGGTHPKLHAFVFEGHAGEPVAVAKAMAVQEEAAHLERELATVEILRERLGGDPEMVATLPVKPIRTMVLQDDYVVVEPVDPLGAAVGQAGRREAFRWLRRFQEGTSPSSAAWSDADDRESVAAVENAWRRARPVSRHAVVRCVEQLGRELCGTILPRCPVHGDFWRGNLAFDGERMRVFDWEWLDLDGRPLFDLWTYDLAEMRQAADRGETRFDEPMARALSGVRAELSARGLDERLALATLAPVIAHLTFRVRIEMGRKSGNEAASEHIMAAAERLLLAGA